MNTSKYQNNSPCEYPGQNSDTHVKHEDIIYQITSLYDPQQTSDQVVFASKRNVNYFFDFIWAVNKDPFNVG